MPRSPSEKQGKSPLFRAEGIEVRFGGLVALSEVDMTVGGREILGLIGPNGAGKTTMLNVLSGFQRAAEGQVRNGDVDITAWSPSARVRCGIARTFQGVRAFPELSVRENVALGCLGAGHGRLAGRARAERLLDEFELGSAADLVAGSLPYGAMRRLGIARAVASDPTLLLLDEPAAGLSEDESLSLLRTLLQIRDERGCSLVVIEHDMRLIMRLCDRIQVLDHGKTIALGTPKEIQEDPAVIDAYLGEGRQRA